MDGWIVNGCMDDDYMNGLMDEWFDDEWTDGQMDGWLINRQIDELMNC